MSAEMMPLYWRIAGHEHNGQEAVSLLMPAGSGETPTEFPTEVFFQSTRPRKQPVDVRWSEEDSDLFMNLLDRVVDTETGDDITLDINDGVVQGIVQLVALARFKKPARLDEQLGDDLNVCREEVEVGDLVALHTLNGFVLAITVCMDSIDSTCVLLEPILAEDGSVLVTDNTLITVERVSALPASFADSDEGSHETFH